MRAFTSVGGVKLLVVFSLFLLFGCAQNAYSVKDAKPDAGEMATLSGIAVSGEGNAFRVEIMADRPLTYTYYTLKDPSRTVIDLALADAGSVKAPLLSDTSVIRKIDIEKSELSSGSMVRVTIETNGDVTFNSAADSTDNTKLVFNLVSEQKPSTVALPEPVTSRDLDQKPDTDVSSSDKTTPDAAPNENSASSPVAKPAIEDSALTANSDNSPKPEPFVPQAVAKEETVPSQHTPQTITSLDAVSDGIIIQTGGPVSKFKYFTLTKPQRLAVDIYNVRNGLSSKTIPLNSSGIASARVGTYPDKVRVVFDSSGSAFPQFKLEKLDSGIKVVLSGSSKSPSVETLSEKVAPNTVKGSASLDQPGKSAAVEAIDFKIVDGYSRISVTTNGDCALSGPVKIDDGLVMTFAGCSLPKRLQRPFDTSAFSSVVKRVTPYQIRIKGRQDAKILVALRGGTPYTIKREGDVIHLDVKNPEEASSPQLLSGKEEYPVAAVSQKPAEAAKLVEPEKTAVNSVLPEKKIEKKVYTGKRVTLEFVDADIRKIFQLIAEVSNLNILVGDDVSGTISIKLVNVPWDQALDVILETKGLGMKRKDNIVVIRPLNKITSHADEQLAAQRAYERSLDLKTKIFDVNYASVSDVAGQFNTYKSERGTISVDARTNRVIVNDIAPRIDKMTDLLKYLDIPEKQVLIEARIVEATSTFTQDLGIQWGIHYRDGSASLLGINSLDTGFGGLITNIPPASGFQSATTAGGSMGLSFGKLTSNVQIDLRLSAASENGEVKIISTPKVVTLNNKAAKISQGQMIPYSTVSAEGTKTEFIEAALTLEVTPHITADGGVSMKIKATNNSAGSAAVGVAPPINKKEATTELLVQNGETTVIGGIYVDSDSNTDSGVPYLKDIPLLGWLFKSNNQRKTKSELLIFITPKIVS